MNAHEVIKWSLAVVVIGLGAITALDVIRASVWRHTIRRAIRAAIGSEKE